MSSNQQDNTDLADRPGGVYWYSREDQVQLETSAVRAVGIAVYVQAGATQSDAEFLVDERLNKAIQGDFARGRFDEWAVLGERVRRGEVNLHPCITVLRETGASVLLDDVPGAPKALLCRAAMDRAIEKARTSGIGLAGVRCPAGILTTQVMQAVKAGMVGIVLTQSYPLVAPLGGIRAMLGDAPIAFGIPSKQGDPVVLDMALTNSSATGVRYVGAGRLVADGQAPGEIRPGLVLDEHGEPTTQASALFFDTPSDRRRTRGSLLPLGGGHKGYALIFIVTLLCSVLTSTDFPWEPEEIAVGGLPIGQDRHFGSLHIAIDPAALGSLDEFNSRVSEFIEDVKATPRRPDAEEIFYPGEQSQRLRRQRIAEDTILLPRGHYETLRKIAVQVGMSANFPNPGE
jgi:L-2-hydroxycarboxylate dehydrogenase (NAD+)